MDIQAIFSDIKDKIISLYEKVCDYCRENKKMAIIIAGLSVFIIVLVIILIASLGTKKEKTDLQMPLILSEQPLIPNSPEIQNDYNMTRKTEKSWSEESLDEWFTIPSDKEIDSLGKTNDTIITEILGAAP